MAVDLFSSSSSTLSLSSLRSSTVPRPSLPSRRPTGAPAPPLRRQRSPIVSPLRMALSTAASTQEVIKSDISIKNSTSDDKAEPKTNLNLQMFSLANIPPWATLVLGSVVFLVIPFCRKALKLQDVTKAMDTVAVMVEKVAEVTEKVAEEVAAILPSGELKEAVIKLEKIALMVDKGAEVTESFIDKVDDAVEVLDASLKPATVSGGGSKIDNVKDQNDAGIAAKIAVGTTTVTTELKDDGSQR
ncbi:hypothetical protein AXF42_Ash016515 [Apostasia shenzhenica]|uniref:Uncharacterized protein n=1 Tax=Apostasia shenzhenica TaxID=1088818 RepID=A0A2I0AVC4_9ASPA|nr:hypothetical protein AXF42_Ash016515 [Apostasia shenzhenica]